jgi:hypothetical protein
MLSRIVPYRVAYNCVALHCTASHRSRTVRSTGVMLIPDVLHLIVWGGPLGLSVRIVRSDGEGEGGGAEGGACDAVLFESCVRVSKFSVNISHLKEILVSI